MSLFQCEECGCRENTATSGYWTRNDPYSACKGRKLCSACDQDIGKWHGKFERLFLRKNSFKTGRSGNLEHISSGSEDYRPYIVEQPKCPQ